MAIAITMATSIQVSKKTQQLLGALKKKLSAKSYDEILRRLISEKLEIPASMFGSSPRLSSFKERDEAEFHEL